MTHTPDSPGWYVDPINGSQFRYWNGVSWTNDTRTQNPTAAAPVGPTANAKIAYKTIANVALFLGLVTLALCAYFVFKSFGSCDGTTGSEFYSCIDTQGMYGAWGLTLFGVAVVIFVVGRIVEKAGK